MDMQATLTQLQSLAAQAGQTADKPSVAPAGNFAQTLRASLDRVNQLGQTATDQARALQMGQPDVALYDVVLDQQKASMALQMSVQVRNRLVSAYKEIMNMQV